MKILRSDLSIELLKEAEKVINDPYKIMVGDAPDGNGETVVWYGDVKDVFSFGQAVGVIRTSQRLMQEIKA
jgi:hypothetical protein